MDKNYKLLIIILTLIIVSCKQSQKSEKKVSNEYNSSTQVKVDDRIELFRLAYNLAIMDSISSNLRPCKDQFYSENYLPYKKYSNHPLVQRIAKGDLWNGDLPILALALDKNLQPKHNLDKTLLKDLFGWYGENLDSVAIMLADFKETIKFKNDYNINFEPYRDSLESNNLTTKLNDFYRTDLKSELTIYFDPLNSITSRAINFLPEKENKRRFVLNNICDKSESLNIKKPLTLYWTKDTRRITIHENSHLYTDNLFSKYYSSEFDKKLKQDKYANEHTNIDEIIVRGLTAKILELNYGIEIGKFEYERLWPRSKIVFDQLEKYNGTKTLTFEEVYKKIINKLEESYS